MAITIGMIGISIVSFLLGVSIYDLKEESKEDKIQMVVLGVFLLAVMVIGGWLDV